MSHREEEKATQPISLLHPSTTRKDLHNRIDPSQPPYNRSQSPSNPSIDPGSRTQFPSSSTEDSRLHARDEDNRKGKEEGDDEGREVGDPVVGLFGRAGDRRVDGVRVREESGGFSGRRMDDMGDRMGRRGDRGGRVD
jgi:hypothetical protein